MIKLIVSILMFVPHAFAAGSGNGSAKLNNVSFEESNGKTLVHFEMNSPADVANLETRFLKRTVEWDLKNTSLKKDKIFLDVGANDINNVYVSHNDEKSVRIRVNLDNGKMASNYHERISFLQNKNNLTMVMNTAVPLITSNIKELNRVYDVATSQEAKVAEHMNNASVLKVGATAPVSDLGAASAEAESDADADESDTIVLEESKSEKEIPLQMKNKDIKTAGGPSLWRMFIGLGAAGLMLLSVVVISRKINRKRLGAAFNHDSITVISQKYLGPKRNLTLVRVSGEYMLLGVTDHNISLIKTLSVVDDEIPALTPNDFGSAVKSMSAKADSFEEQVEDIEDSFSVSSLSDVKKMFKKRKYIDE